MTSFITKPFQWINDLFPGQPPLTEHQLVLLARGELRSCKSLVALPSNAAPRANYIEESHPLWMMCFRSKEASKDKDKFKKLQEKAAAGNRIAIRQLAGRTARLNRSKTALFDWISGLPEVIAEARRLEVTLPELVAGIYRTNFPKHTSVDDLAEAMTSDEGIAVCMALVFNPFARLQPVLPPPAEESELAPAPALPPAAEEGDPLSAARCIERCIDADEGVFDVPPMTLEQEEELYLRRRAERAAALPPAAEEGTPPDLPPAAEEAGLIRSVGLGPTPYSDAEFMEFSCADRRLANARAIEISKLPANGEGLEELIIPPPGFEPGRWGRLLNTCLNKRKDKLVLRFISSIAASR